MSLTADSPAQVRKRTPQARTSRNPSSTSSGPPVSSFHSFHRFGPTLSPALALTPFTSPRGHPHVMLHFKNRGLEAYLHSTCRKSVRAKLDSTFYNKVMTTHSGKKDLPGRRSSVDTASGEPFPAALARIPWKQLEWAEGEAGRARTHRRFEALKPDFYKPVVC